jgi:hypothetical protein
MSYHVTSDYIELDGKFYNLGFIILKNGEDWTHYYHLTKWSDEVRLPKSFYTLELGSLGRHYYHPCAPFQLSRDQCSDWLTWATVRPENGNGDEVKLLKYSTDPQEVHSNERFMTQISEFIQFGTWADQLSATPQQSALGNLSRMENLVRSTINNSMRNLANTVANRVRQEFSDLPLTDRRYRRSRSPDRDRPGSNQLIQPTQQMNPIQYYQPGTAQNFLPQQQIPQQMMQPQVTPQMTPQQWNPGMQAQPANYPIQRTNP